MNMLRIVLGRVGRDDIEIETNVHEDIITSISLDAMTDLGFMPVLVVPLHYHKDAKRLHTLCRRMDAEIDTEER